MSSSSAAATTNGNASSTQQQSQQQSQQSIQPLKFDVAQLDAAVAADAGKELDINAFASSPLTAQILGHKSKRDNNQEYTVYFVRVLGGEQSFTIVRRYSEFLKLRNELAVFFERNLAPFPPKTMSLSSPQDSDTISLRAVALERFLQSCFQHQLIFASLALLQFLDLPMRLGNPQQRGVFVVAYDKAADAAQYGNVPRPVLFRRNEPILVLVRVRAAAVTPLDARIRRGDERLVFPYQLPLVLGFDFSGEVVAVGAAVKDFRVGDAVFGRLDDRCIGAFAEYALVAAPLLAVKPPNVTHEEAATFPSLAMTVHQALVDEVKLQRGETLFVNGGGTGLGSFAIQYATAVLGAKVTASCAASVIERCKQLGAVNVIDQSDETAVAAVRGLDVAIDTAGQVDTALWTVKVGGRFIATSLSDKSGDALKRHSVLSVPRYVRWLASANNSITLAQAAARRIRYTSVLPRAAGDVMRSVATAIGEGKLKPFIDRVYRLEQIGEAMAYVDKGNVPGTVVLDVTPTADEERRRSLSPQPFASPAPQRQTTSDDEAEGNGNGNNADDDDDEENDS